MEIETARLKLKPFNDSHYEGLRAMDNDASVMRYINKGIVKTPEETMESIRRVQARWDKHGFSWWAIKEKRSGVFVGAACLQHLANVENAPWRLAGGLFLNITVKAMQRKRLKRSLILRSNKWVQRIWWLSPIRTIYPPIE